MTIENKRIILASYPEGCVSEENFQLDIKPIPEVPEDGVLIRNIYMSVDPYMRGRMTKAKSYIPPFQIGEPLEAGMVGQVLESRNSNYQKGDYVTGMLNWEEYTLTNGLDKSGARLKKLDPAVAPLSYHLGILGMPGMTAWVGVNHICEAKAEENLFVSAASGAVGSVVGQIGKNLGLRVVGSAGGPEKCEYLTNELGFDQAIDYKTVENPYKALRKAFPDMIDVLFENVGGPMFEAAILNMNFMGRIALCGMISDYNKTLEEMEPGPRGLMTLVGRNIKMQGFIVFNYPEVCKDWVKVGSNWLSEGKLKYHETIAEGIENTPNAFIGMLKGKNLGKQIVKISDQ